MAEPWTTLYAEAIGEGPFYVVGQLTDRGNMVVRILVPRELDEEDPERYHVNREAFAVSASRDWTNILTDEVLTMVDEARKSKPSEPKASKASKGVKASKVDPKALKDLMAHGYTATEALEILS